MHAHSDIKFCFLTNNWQILHIWMTFGSQTDFDVSFGDLCDYFFSCFKFIVQLLYQTKQMMEVFSFINIFKRMYRTDVWCSMYKFCVVCMWWWCVNSWCMSLLYILVVMWKWFSFFFSARSPFTCPISNTKLF